MKRSEIKELKNRPHAELKHLLKENREALRKLKFDLVAGKLKNVGAIRKLKKTIARIATFLRIPREGQKISQ